ncbi:MAG: sugar phosphate isomerase/epimerase family protein [Acidobacteriota bacterium]
MNQQQKQRRAFLTNAAQAAAAVAVGGWRNKLAAAEASETGSAKDALPIQIGILLGTVRSGSLAARLDAVKAVGLDCVQLSMDCAGLPMMPDEISAELARQIRREAAERGITIASVAGTFNMCHPDAEHRQTGLRRLRVLAEACSLLGVKKIHLCSGTRDRTSMWRRHPDNDTPEAWRDMAASMRVAADIARQNRVILAFEPEVNNVVNSAKKARRLMDEIGSPNLKVTLDAANLFPKGELPRMKEILDEAFTLIGRDIVLAHAKDLDHDGDAGHLAAGQGKLDYDRYVGLLHKYKFPGPLLLHSLTEVQMPGCVTFLREKIGRLNAKPPGK